MDLEEARKLIERNVDLKGIRSSITEDFLSLKKAAEEGEWTWKMAGALAGALLSLSGFLGLATAITKLSAFLAVFNVYLSCFGLAMVALEHKDQCITKNFLATLRAEAPFLTHPYGRSLFYIFVGAMVLVAGGWLNFLVGTFTTLTGILIYVSSKAAYANLNKLKDMKMSEQEVAAKFQSFDQDASGSLEASELAKLCQSLGSPLSHNELESALLILDKDGDGAVSCAESVAHLKYSG